MKTARHIGGSLLPSSEPRILQPIDTPRGVPLHVRAVPELDTHGLFATGPQGESCLAMHPNGYSCHELAKRLAAGDVARAREQARYILDCGGMTRNFDAVTYYAESN